MQKNLSNVILNNKYQFDKRIGSGSYGIVYSATHLFTGQKFAIKIILKNISSNNSNNKQLLLELENQLLNQATKNNYNLTSNLLNLKLIEENGLHCKILKEISLQLRVHKHPNILSIYKVYDTKDCLFVVMDYFPDGDLFNMIVEQKRYANDPFLVKSVFIQLLDAISYCHSKNIYHCDLKPENILVANNGTKLILADFGLALQSSLIKSNICCGSSYYMAPERLQNFCIGFNSKDAHSMHLERLMLTKKTNNNNNNNNDGDEDNDLEQGMHENIYFPTASGDIWSLSIILINLISIRNPWLKASLNDNTFKAFIQNPKILLKILPISIEVFQILQKFLCINPWDRKDLFTFREDIIKCSTLSQQGPLSIDSRIIKKIKVELTDSQMFNPDQLLSNSSSSSFGSEYEIYSNELLACKAPIDHVMLNKIRSRENLPTENVELEHNYIIDLPLPGMPSPTSDEEQKPKKQDFLDIVSGPVYIRHDYRILNRNLAVGGNNDNNDNNDNNNNNNNNEKLHDKCGSCLTCGFGCLEDPPSNKNVHSLKARIFKSKLRHHHDNDYYSNSPSSPVNEEELKTHELVNSKIDDLINDYDLIFQSDVQFEHQMKLNQLRLQQLEQQQQQQSKDVSSGSSSYFSVKSTNDDKQDEQMYETSNQKRQQYNTNNNNDPIEVAIHSPITSRPHTPRQQQQQPPSSVNLEEKVNLANIDISMISIMSVKSSSEDNPNDSSDGNNMGDQVLTSSSINYSIQGEKSSINQFNDPDPKFEIDYY